MVVGWVGVTEPNLPLPRDSQPTNINLFHPIGGLAVKRPLNSNAPKSQPTLRRSFLQGHLEKHQGAILSSLHHFVGFTWVGWVIVLEEYRVKELFFCRVCWRHGTDFVGWVGF